MDNETADRLTQAIFSLSKSIDDLTFEVRDADVSALSAGIDNLINALVK